MGSKERLTISTIRKSEAPASNGEVVSIGPEPVEDAVTEADERRFFAIISTDLNAEQRGWVAKPEQAFPRKTDVMALHWHPEFIPMELIRERIHNMFPNMDNALIIPTQHNELLSYDGVYSGVEIDCYSKGFNQKVQLLLHMRKEVAEQAAVLQSMAAYTYKYRSSQLFDFMHSFVKPIDERLEAAARETGADAQLIAFVTGHVKKLHTLIETHHDKIPPLMVKNKLLRNYFDMLRDVYDDVLIDRAQAYLKAVKVVVKREFPLTYFYRTREVIEEARAENACIVIPHPEQFWPILMADYDVDGIEIWNPQSRRYTDFMISVLNKENRAHRKGRGRLLVLMGDDTHMGEKVKPPAARDMEKASREIGLQPGWDDLFIKKKLILAEMELRSMMAEYRERLG